MTTMIERATEAAQSASKGKPFLWQNAVREVLGTLKTPTPAMIAAGVAYRLKTSIHRDNNWPMDTAMLFAAMIDAALKESADEKQ